MSLIGCLYFLKPGPALGRWVCCAGLGISPRASDLRSTRHSLESPPHVGPGGCHQTSHCPECVLGGVQAAASAVRSRGQIASECT